MTIQITYSTDGPTFEELEPEVPILSVDTVADWVYEIPKISLAGSQSIELSTEASVVTSHGEQKDITPLLIQKQDKEVIVNPLYYEDF